MFRSICKRSMRPSRWVLAGAGALSIAAASNASVVFDGSGYNPEVNASASGSAFFTVSGNTLTIVLTNTTGPRTTAQGNALTGVVFDILGGSPALSLSAIALTAGSEMWTSETASTTSGALAGSWTSALGSTPLAAYGAATTGFNGAFHGGSITLGNSSPNYGIVAANTFDGTNVPFGGSQFPFIQKALTLSFTGASGLTDSQFANVRLLFGTDGTGVVGTQTIPAPGAMALVLVAAGIGSRRRRS